MLGMDEIGIFVVDVEDVFEHTQHEAGDGEDFLECVLAELAGDCDEQGNAYEGKENPPLAAPLRD